jgi:uncharacterized protein (DUF1015 family)
VPDLRPFRGLRYDLSVVGDLGGVLCPPYDVISAAERARLVERDPHNAVRLELPDSYDSASALIDQWQREGALARDERPLIYLYEQRYLISNVEMVARSFFCRLRLEEYGQGSGVLPHEHTMSGPKEDRFKLLSATRINLSPVLFLYDDGGRGALSAGLLDAITGVPPTARAAGPDGVEQRLWVVDPDVVPEAGKLLALAAARPIYVADGHHRYETALRYRREHPGEPGADFVLALLYDAHSGGLALRPWHRVIAGPLDAAAALATAATNFASTPVNDAQELLARMRVGDPAPPSGTLGMWTRAGGAVLATNPAQTQQLDVDVLSDTLPAMIGSTSAELSANGRLTYTADAFEAIAAVDEGRADVAFLVRPTPVEAVLSVARSGGFMPAKSTYFHPKAATGLVFNPLWD